MTTNKNAKREAREEYLSNLIDQLSKSAKLDSLTSFVDEVRVPADIYAALQSGRPELIRIVQPRPLAEDDCRELYKLIAVLIETNMAFRAHAEQVAQLVNIWADAFKQLERVGLRIENFANFRHPEAIQDTEQ